MTEPVVRRVPVAAAIQRATNPHKAPDRYCPECGQKQRAGMVRCRGCRTGNTSTLKGKHHGFAVDSA